MDNSEIKPETIKVEVMRTKDVEIHKLAHLTPTMTQADFIKIKNSIAINGQEDPIIMYRGKCIDGRHRTKALLELGVEYVKYTNEDSTMSIGDIKNKVLHINECRRHQTPTQKAILAYREYEISREEGDKTSQGVVAEMFGTTVKQLGRAAALKKLAGDEIIELLFQGNKINIGTERQPNNTDSLDSLIKYFQKHRESIITQTEQSRIGDEYTDEEIAQIRDTVKQLQDEYSHRMLKMINKIIYGVINDK